MSVRRGSVFVVALALALAFASRARADDLPIVRDDTNIVVRTPPVAVESPSFERRGIDDWEDRHHATFELGLAVEGGGLGIQRRSGGHLGGALVVGLHLPLHLRHEPTSEKFGSLESEGARWCVPVVMCAGLGLIFAPTGAILANDVGFELRVGGAGEAGVVEGGAVRASLRTTLRYARGAARTNTLLGPLVPEVGVVVPTSAFPVAATFAWTPYPIDLLVAPGVALAIDPMRVGLRVPFDGNRVGVEVGAELGLRWIPR